MTDLAATAPQDPNKRFNAPQKRRISANVRKAIEAMVWDGLNRGQAAKSAGITDHTLYCALRSSQVRAYYLAELEVLRTSERSRNIHTLCAVRDQTSNQMARVNAVQALERIENQQDGSGIRQAAPGLTIVIQTAPGNVSLPTDTAKPLIEHE